MTGRFETSKKMRYKFQFSSFFSIKDWLNALILSWVHRTTQIRFFLYLFLLEKSWAKQWGLRIYSSGKKTYFCHARNPGYNKPNKPRKTTVNHKWSSITLSKFLWQDWPKWCWGLSYHHIRWATTIYVLILTKQNQFSQFLFWIKNH